MAHETCTGRVSLLILKHLFNNQEFCDSGMDLPAVLSAFGQQQRRSNGQTPSFGSLSWRPKVKLNVSSRSAELSEDFKGIRWRKSVVNHPDGCKCFGFAITHLTPALCALLNTSLYKPRSRTEGCYMASLSISDLFPASEILFSYILLCQYNCDGMPLQVSCKGEKKSTSVQSSREMRKRKQARCGRYCLINTCVSTAVKWM